MRPIQGSFAPLTGADGATHRGHIAAAANAALRGESHNTGRFTATGRTFTLQDRRLGVGRVLLLSPANAEAGTLGWHVASMRNNQAEIIFTSAPSGAEFNYVIIGHGMAGSL